MTVLEDRRIGHIVLVGEMGVGKTTVGRALAGSLGWPFLDSDAVLERESGHEAAALAAARGVDALHDLELRLFLEITSTPPRAVVAAAASVVDRPEARERLRRETAVWLTAPEEVVARRYRAGGHRRAASAEERAGLRRRRKPHLERLATLRVDVATATPEEVSAMIVGRLQRMGIIPVSEGGSDNRHGSKAP